MPGRNFLAGELDLSGGFALLIVNPMPLFTRCLKLGDGWVYHSWVQDKIQGTIVKGSRGWVLSEAPDSE